MSDKNILVDNNKLDAKQGVAVTTTIVVQNASLSDVDVLADDGVAHELDTATGTLTLSSNAVGHFEIALSFKDDQEVHDIVVLDVTAEEQHPVVVDTPPATDATTTTPDAPAAPVETPVAPVAPVAPVVEASVEPTPTPVAVVPQQDKTLADRNFEDFIQRMEDYAKDMSPQGIISAIEGCRHQVKLFKTLQIALNAPAVEFHKYMDYLLDFVKTHRAGVFNERFINRFLSDVQLNKEERLLFTRLTTLLTTTVDAGDKKLVAARVDFKYIADRIKNDSVMQKLINYFNPSAE